jgi:hypothetical protein
MVRNKNEKTSNKPIYPFSKGTKSRQRTFEGSVMWVLVNVNVGAWKHDGKRPKLNRGDCVVGKRMKNIRKSAKYY